MKAKGFLFDLYFVSLIKLRNEELVVIFNVFNGHFFKKKGITSSFTLKLVPEMTVNFQFEIVLRSPGY